MKYRAEYIVEKRDGRSERFRATKLARSIHLALLRAREPDPGRSVEATVAVVRGLRLTRSRGHPTRTWEIAAAVDEVLRGMGCDGAARAFARTGCERRRRKGLWYELMAGCPAGSLPAPRRGP